MVCIYWFRFSCVHSCCFIVTLLYIWLPRILLPTILFWILWCNHRMYGGITAKRFKSNLAKCFGSYTTIMLFLSHRYSLAFSETQSATTCASSRHLCCVSRQSQSRWAWQRHAEDRSCATSKRRACSQWLAARCGHNTSRHRRRCSWKACGLH